MQQAANQKVVAVVAENNLLQNNGENALTKLYLST